eukprot:COSAG04_NODE_122_length_24803_cov_180.609415_4_plen_264_part_00
MMAKPAASCRRGLLAGVHCSCSGMGQSGDEPGRGAASGVHSTTRLSSTVVQFNFAGARISLARQYSQRVPATPERRNQGLTFTPPPLSSSSPEPAGLHTPVPPSPSQVDLPGPSCPLWSLWPASARSSAHRSAKAGHHDPGRSVGSWGGGAGSAAGGTGRGLGQRVAGRCGGRGPAGFSRPRYLAAARLPAVLCRAARVRDTRGTREGHEVMPTPRSRCHAREIQPASRTAEPAERRPLSAFAAAKPASTATTYLPPGPRCPS